MDDHVGKPFRRDALLAIVDRWTEGLTTSGKPEATIDPSVFEDLKEVVGREGMIDLLAMLADELAQRFGPSSLAHERERVAGDAHAMISAASMVGFKSLADLCRRVEEACRAGEAYESLLTELSARSAETIEEITILRAA